MSPSRKTKRKKHIIKLAVIGAGFFVLFSTAFGALTIASFVRNLPNTDELLSRRVNQSTKIYDRTGETLLYEIHGEEKRTVIPYEEIPEYVKQATLTIEDQGFYDHPAFDWRAILRALAKDILHLEKREGASTITQQLAKNAYLSREKTITRKVKELLLAIELEKQFTKDEILHLYLNQIPYGSNAYGIEAAAKTYFLKNARELTLAESALLAALPQAPSYYSPYGLHKDELLSRKDFILGKMLELNYIDEAQHETATRHEFTFAPQATTIKAPHFVIAVQEYLVNKYGFETAENGGLRVITTLDWELQQVAEKAVYDGVARNEELYEGRNGALFAEDPKTGEVLAMVGSKDYFDAENEGNFNVATQGLRQPGSAFKPFAYVTAFKRGYTPETVVFDLETEFDTTGIPTRSYKPGNFDEKFRGPVNLRTGLAQSINIPAAKIMYLAGIDNVLKTAADFGITTLTERSRYGISLVLGGGEVKLSELVHAYSVFADDGRRHTQTLVLSVEDDSGALLEEYADRATEAIDPQYARTINDILSDVEARSGLFGASLGLTLFSGHDVALKTGTTNNYVDAWTVGYTPNLVVGVWAGNNHREPLQARGGSILAAVPMWSEFMRAALATRETTPFIKPEPYSATKPILRGDYAAGRQVHSLLYYINKNNPQGPAPFRPEDDPQFSNWEEPVLVWAAQNIGDFGSYNQGTFGPPQAESSSITIYHPQNGSFVGNSFSLSFEAENSSGITSVDVLLNGSLLEKNITQGNRFSYNKTIVTQGLQTQNQLTIRVHDTEGNTTEKDIILYK